MNLVSKSLWNGHMFWLSASMNSKFYQEDTAVTSENKETRKRFFFFSCYLVKTKKPENISVPSVWHISKVRGRPQYTAWLDFGGGNNCDSSWWNESEITSENILQEAKVHMREMILYDKFEISACISSSTTDQSSLPPKQ